MCIPALSSSCFLSPLPNKNNAIFWGRNFCLCLEKNRCGYTSQWALQQQLTARQPNKEKQEQQQQQHSSVIYLCQLLFNKASVLQCDRLLFGALCCQHLVCRAKNVAEKELQCNTNINSTQYPCHMHHLHKAHHIQYCVLWYCVHNFQFGNMTHSISHLTSNSLFITYGVWLSYALNTTPLHFLRYL